MRRALPYLVVLLAAEAAVAPVHAATREPGAADELFRRGQALVASGDYPHACELFRESHRLDPAPGTLLNLADCEEHLDKLASALGTFRAAMDELAPGDDRVPYVTQEIAKLTRRVPHLLLRLTSAPDGSLVSRDGVELGPSSLDVSLPVDPGAHVLVVRAPGHPDRTYRIALAEAESKEVTLEPSPVESPAPPVPDAGPRTSTVIAVSLLGLGAACLGVGTATGIVALNDASAVRSGCTNGTCTQPSLVSTAHAGETFATTSSITLAVGAAAAAVGGFLLGRNLLQTAVVAPVVAPHAGGIGVSGTF